MSSSINSRKLKKAEQAIIDEAMNHGLTTIETMEWETALNAVKKTLRTSNFQKQVEITKEAFSKIKSEKLKERHREYISSDQWKRRRNEKLKREDYTCEKCGGQACQAHHKHYKFFDSENKEAEISSLMAVCRECHERIEDVDSEIKTANVNEKQFSAEENLRKFNEKYLEDLKDMKEKESEEGMSNGRRRWFNQEISKVKKEIKEGSL